MRHFPFLIVALFLAQLAAAQSFQLNGSVTVKVFVSHPVGKIPVHLQTFHAFPVFDYSEASDSLLANRTAVAVSCPVRSLQEGYLTIGDVRVHLLLVPGDTISVVLRSAGKDSKVDFGGKTADVQYYYQLKSKQFPISIDQQLLTAASDEPSLAAFKIIADSLIQQQSRFWARATDREVRIDGKPHEAGTRLPDWFIRYETDAMRYNNATNRIYAIGYQEFVLHRKKGDIPEGYFDFLKGLPISNETALYDYTYQMFLLNYFSYKAERNPSTLGHAREFELVDEMLTENVAGFYKLNSIGVSLVATPKEVLSELDKLKPSPTLDYLARYLRERAQSKIKFLKAGDAAPDFFLEDQIDSLVSLSQFKGEVIYLSFWFAGCKGCVEEFPNENALVREFAGRPVKIVNICTRTAKTKWLQMIDKHKLNTVNLFANKAWGEKLEDRYAIGAYPHYVLIDREGHLIHNYAKRPREIAQDIEAALNN